MTSTGKFWLWVIFLSVITVFGVRLANSKMLVEHSVAREKNEAPQGDLGALYSELGIQQGKHVRLNPCFDIEELTRKYCTPHAIQLLLSEHAFVGTEDQLLRKLLLHDYPCDQVALYIGRVCHQKNFKKIFRHYAMKK